MRSGQSCGTRGLVTAAGRDSISMRVFKILLCVIAIEIFLFFVTDGMPNDSIAQTIASGVFSIPLLPGAFILDQSRLGPIHSSIGLIPMIGMSLGFDTVGIWLALTGIESLRRRRSGDSFRKV